MDEHSTPWPTFAQGSMTSAHDGLGIVDAHDQFRSRSQSEDAEWQRIVEEVSGSNEASSTDFGLFCASDIAMLQQSPARNIASTTAQETQQIMSATSSSSLSLSSMPPNDQYQGWPASNVPVPLHPQLTAERNPWIISQTLQECFPPRGPTTIMHTFDSIRHSLIPAHHLNASPSSFLDQASPLHRDAIDDAWDQIDEQQHCSDGSGGDGFNDLDATDPCYAQLLYRCLRETPAHTLTLRELYEWIKQHSQKASDPKNRGWQNSVRHNLSMNAAFERVPPSDSQGVKKGSSWRLTPAALRDGVISTTRYRKDPKRKPERRSAPAPKRQLSGRKGGQATRNATRRQHALREASSFPTSSAAQRHRRNQRSQGPAFFTPTPVHSARPSPRPAMLIQHPPASPYFVDLEEHAAIHLPSPYTPPQLQLMFGEAAKPALSEFEFSHISFANGGLIGNHNDVAPDTPSLATEASFITDDCLQSLRSHNASRETTSFPMEC